MWVTSWGVPQSTTWQLPHGSFPLSLLHVVSHAALLYAKLTEMSDENRETVSAVKILARRANRIVPPSSTLLPALSFFILFLFTSLNGSFFLLVSSLSCPLEAFLFFLLVHSTLSSPLSLSFFIFSQHFFHLHLHLFSFPLTFFYFSTIYIFFFFLRDPHISLSCSYSLTHYTSFFFSSLRFFFLLFPHVFSLSLHITFSLIFSTLFLLFLFFS